jgi:hypothetical protein
MIVTTASASDAMNVMVSTSPAVSARRCADHSPPGAMAWSGAAGIRCAVVSPAVPAPASAVTSSRVRARACSKSTRLLPVDKVVQNVSGWQPGRDLTGRTAERAVATVARRWLQSLRLPRRRGFRRTRISAVVHLENSWPCSWIICADSLPAHRVPDRLTACRRCLFVEGAADGRLSVPSSANPRPSGPAQRPASNRHHHDG